MCTEILIPRKVRNAFISRLGPNGFNPTKHGSFQIIRTTQRLPSYVEKTCEYNYGFTLTQSHYQQCCYVLAEWTQIFQNPFCQRKLAEQAGKQVLSQMETEMINIKINTKHSGEIFSRRYFGTVFRFLPENRICHFMQIISITDNLHEMPNAFFSFILIFFGKNKKHIINVSSSELAKRVVKVKQRLIT